MSQVIICLGKLAYGAASIDRWQTGITSSVMSAACGAGEA